MRRAAILVLVGGFVLLVASGSGATPATAKAAMYWQTGVAAVLPADAAAGSAQGAGIESVSCASPGNCSAVGTYVDQSKVAHGLLLTETAGKWSAGVEALLPADADPTSPDPFFNSVSCSSAGNCAADGGYTDNAGHLQSLLLTETAGVWGAGVEAALPANAIAENQLVILSSVSCPADGECTAAGVYNVNSDTHAMVLTETGGVWATGTEAATPGDAPTLAVSSVSCPAFGNCSAVGEYDDNAGHLQGVMWTESAGVWGAGVEVALPANASAKKDVYLTSVSCASAGNCTAVGYYNVGGLLGNGLLLTETAGTWEAGVEAVPPSGAGKGTVELISVSCASARNCAVVGDYEDGSLGLDGFMLSEKRGVWSKGVTPTLPAKARGDGTFLSSVSCAPAGNCATVGQDTSNRALLLTKTAGRWKATFAALPPNAHGGELVTVSCPTTQYCTAGGSSLTNACAKDGACGEDGLTIDGTPIQPCVVPKLEGETEVAAKRSIKSHGCAVGRIKHVRSRKTSRGHVIAQHPRPGRRLRHAAKVSLTVSRGR